MYSRYSWSDEKGVRKEDWEWREAQGNSRSNEAEAEAGIGIHEKENKARNIKEKTRKCSPGSQSMRNHVIQLQKSKRKNHLSLLSLTPCIQFISNSGGASLPKLFFILVVSTSLVQATISLCLDGCNHPCLYTCPPVFATQQSGCHQMSGRSHRFSAQKPYTCPPVFQRQSLATVDNCEYPRDLSSVTPISCTSLHSHFITGLLPRQRAQQAHSCIWAFALAVPLLWNV